MGILMPRGTDWNDAKRIEWCDSCGKQFEMRHDEYRNMCDDCEGEEVICEESARS